MNTNISIAVIGSINLDLVATVKEFPQPGETVTNAVVSHYPGGKGANQAVGAARAGGDSGLACRPCSAHPQAASPSTPLPRWWWRQDRGWPGRPSRSTAGTP